MKNFPFRIVFICIFLPPIFYILTLQVFEGVFQKIETESFKKILIQDYDALYSGRYSVKEEISKNISTYLSRNLKTKIGVRIDVIVKAADDRIVYPSQLKREFDEADDEGDFSNVQMESINYMDLAADNYKLLNSGLSVYITIRISHNSWLSNTILVLYVFMFVFILWHFIQKAAKRTEIREKEQNETIEQLFGQLEDSEKSIKAIGLKEEEYLEQINDLKLRRSDLSKDVNGLLDEIERLEQGLEKERSLKDEKEMEALLLREEIEKVKEPKLKPKKKKRKKEIINKRFKVLYKNIDFSDKAVEGFLSLQDDMQLKSEELIHQLNEDESKVAIKRKVFGKGGKMNILEVLFAYSGRIYFQKDDKSRVKVVAIGTKNTQEKDLNYLESIR